MDKTQSVQHALPAAHAEVRGVISCVICAATYAPTTSYGHLWQASPLTVESAFMSMCRFCFRCRRPACPMCWDEVNGVCGSCAQEAQLPFRSESPMMSGVLFPPLRKTQEAQRSAGPQPLVCVRVGRFQTSTPLPAPVVSIVPVSTDPIRAMLVEPVIQQAFEEKANSGQLVRVIGPTSTVKKKSSRSAKGGNGAVEKEASPVARWVRVVRTIERVLTVIVAVALLVIVVLIVAALVSANANMFIARVINVDIRAEIAYLLQILQQLH